MDTSVVARSGELLCETERGVVHLTLNRPEKRNALSRKLVAELEAALGAIAADPSARVVVLSAAGSVFCSGHDLKEMTGCSEQEYRDLFGTCARMMHRLRRLPQPVIARVQGMATAAGCQLVAACDLAVASERASFATPGVKIGLFCATPMVPLVRAIPAKPAFEMLLTGEPISARRAFELGLVNRVVPEGELDSTVLQYVNPVLASSAEVIRLGKAAFYDGLGLDESAAYERAVDEITGNALHPDAHEGITAFLQKRQPVWSGPPNE
jgi:enoyl-CoA hydratase/carnithine racemase